MLVIEHYHETEESLLNLWIREMRHIRHLMSETIIENYGLYGQNQTTFANVRRSDRESACLRLVEYDQSKAVVASPKTLLRERDSSLPQQCLYQFDDLTGFEQRGEQMPHYDVWTPNVARILNKRLSKDYPDRGEETMEQEFE
ncbi:MAG: hypothetical protein OXL36_21000 [Bryobacterales bacterium]|nr:hypothetical protein [Bryobacterales bacterium]MDE0294937.1 hypothetical protein [Bryobacterales bacterium]